MLTDHATRRQKRRHLGVADTGVACSEETLYSVELRRWGSYGLATAVQRRALWQNFAM